MSNIVFNEKLIYERNIKEKTITIRRIANSTIGVRVWFEVLTDEGECFQRWSMLMNRTDEILILAKPGDSLTFKYVEDIAEDTVNQTFEAFERNIILEITQVDWTN